MRVLVLGISGMLGNAVFSELAASEHYETFGTMRGEGARRYFDVEAQERIMSGVDAMDSDTLARVLSRTRPDVVVNCVGLIKQHSIVNDPLVTLPINSMLPHRLAAMCELGRARLIHISTDCVFSGKQGNYRETDVADAKDLYGQSKFIGEVTHATNAITLRTSIVGHELNSCHALVDWFLSQRGPVKGYGSAIFSGLPTVELARVIRDNVLPRPELFGLYHVAAEPISKLELLSLIAEVYGKEISIAPDHDVLIDRSLNASRFNEVTGYKPADWRTLVRLMHANRPKVRS